MAGLCLITVSHPRSQELPRAQWRPHGAKHYHQQRMTTHLRGPSSVAARSRLYIGASSKPRKKGDDDDDDDDDDDVHTCGVTVIAPGHETRWSGFDSRSGQIVGVRRFPQGEFVAHVARESPQPVPSLKVE
ncbi:hypothetical protein ANN_15999 [Periplaneta americana]|uniref:Uncharacterized protein n=1 Tax=Periplaneta americana TaxID=6978 RepID=A0ABQ8SI71_PERAM|nr:hypothetical protein ANN_15999 [Periplaneta americana]